MIQKPRGTRDFTGEDFKLRQSIYCRFAQLCFSQGFGGMETPIFEERSLFVRSVGEGTDIVQKQLFDLEKKSGEVYSLRPEYTAGVVRSLIETGLRGRRLPIMLYYGGEIFRYDKPQKGRFRQFGQIGIEILGSKEPAIDILGINNAVQFLKIIGINDAVVVLNSLGSAATRQKYSDILAEYLKSKIGDLCKDCKKRTEKNALRVLDCKIEGCRSVVKSAPLISSVYAGEEKQYLEDVNKGLEILEIEAKIDESLIRVLDYYTGNIFEITTRDDIKRENSLGGGGRYDNLIEELGGPKTPAFGYAMGVERLMEEAKIEAKDRKKKVVIIPLGEKEKIEAIRLQNEIKGTAATINLNPKSLGEALSEAAKNGFDFAVIVGEKELKSAKFTLKNLETQEQAMLSPDEIVKKLR